MTSKIAVALASVLVTAAATVGTAGAAGAAPSSGTEYFTISGSGDSQTVVAHGVFADGGTDISKGDKDHLRMAYGSLVVTHPQSDGTASFSINPRTCYFKLVLSGSYTLGDGARAYRNVTGSGTYRGTSEGVAARDAAGACTTKVAPLSEIFIVHAHGPVSFGAAG